jgi:hypothetical protein
MKGYPSLTIPTQCNPLLRGDFIMRTEKSGTLVFPDGMQVFSDLSVRDKLLIAEMLTRYVRTRAKVDEIFEDIDPDCKLSKKGEQTVRLHVDEPPEVILRIITYLLQEKKKPASTELLKVKVS